jgi:elongation factor 1-alpha
MAAPAAIDNMDKKHLSVAITGHVDSGKSTVTGRLLTLLGGVSERELEKLKAEAAALGKESFIYAFVMDKQKDERARGITIACAAKEFFTPNYHYTIIDAPGHRDFVKNMLGGASQADVAVLMVPAEGGFTTAIAAGDHASKEVQGQTRQHARLLNLLGVKQLIVGVNKMDDGTVNWSEARFKEVRDEMRNMLIKVGWQKEFVENCVPVIPLSGWKGDNLLSKSENMAWWKGVDVKQDLKASSTVHIETLFEALDKYAMVPKRRDDAPLRMPLSGCFKIKGVGDVITGRLEQGKCKDGDEVIFLPRHTDANPCTGKVFSVEMHHKKIPSLGW